MREAPAWLHPQQWLPVTAPVTNAPGQRNPLALLEVVRQFDVLTSPRYLSAVVKGVRLTFCNYFLSDVTKALGAPVPQTLANEQVTWLRGNKDGWRTVSRHDADQFAMAGHPTVVAYSNPKGHGHVAILVGPGLIAQAGRANFFMKPLELGFGTFPTTFHTHE